MTPHAPLVHQTTRTSNLARPGSVCRNNAQFVRVRYHLDQPQPERGDAMRRWLGAHGGEERGGVEAGLPCLRRPCNRERRAETAGGRVASESQWCRLSQRCPSVSCAPGEISCRSAGPKPSLNSGRLSIFRCPTNVARHVAGVSQTLSPAPGRYIKHARRTNLDTDFTLNSLEVSVLCHLLRLCRCAHVAPMSPSNVTANNHSGSKRT